MFNFSDKSAYLAATNIKHVLGYVGDVDFSKLKDANVLCAFSGGQYMLAEINVNKETPPNRKCKVVVSGSDEVKTLDVIEVFNIVQHHGIAWCELN